MDARPSASVCIPSRNQAGFIGDALRSAFKQTVAPSDVVVSDDAGTDETAAVVDAFRQTLSPEVRCLLRYERSNAVLGIGGNFDRAVRLARGELVVKLDSDDILEPTFVEVLSRQLQDHPKAGWAHCNVLNIRPDGSPIGLAHTRKKTSYFAAADALPAYLRHNDTCHCVMLRKSAYEAVGGYRPEMKTCEDWLLWLEMLIAGWGYCFDERPLARMRKYDSRPDLMTRRRRDFITSVETMVPRVEAVSRAKGERALSMALEPALQRFRAAVAKLCISSGCDEGDPAVRRTLFDAAYDFRPSAKSWLWREFGARLPTELTRAGSRAVAMPRKWVRLLLQRLRTSTPRRIQ